MGKCISLKTEILLTSLTFTLRLSYVYSSSHLYMFKISTTHEKSFKSLLNYSLSYYQLLKKKKELSRIQSSESTY